MSSGDYIGREVAGQFQIVRKIGSGGMGSVYKAEQPEMNRSVAIKILHPRYLSRADLVARFRREARAMSHLSHPNTARVFLYGQLEDGACYFVMEYLEGKNLAQVVRAEGPLDPSHDTALPLASQDRDLILPDRFRATLGPARRPRVLAIRGGRERRWHRDLSFPIMPASWRLGMDRDRDR